MPIEVVFAKQTLHAGDGGYGALLAAWGAGMVLGSVLYAVATRVRLRVVLALGIMLGGCGYGGIALSPTLAVACAFSAIGGIGNGVWLGAMMTALQQAITRQAQSAVMALLFALNQIMPAIGFALGGVLTAASSPRVTYGVAAAGVVFVLAILLVRPPAPTGAAAGTPADESPGLEAHALVLP